MKRLDFVFPILWNLSLITAGSIVYAIGVKAIAYQHGFVNGGIFGLSLLLNYTAGLMSPGLWYLAINIPLFIVCWFFVGRRFFLYSLAAMVIVTLSFELIQFQITINDQLYAAVAAGVISGAGTGIILRSLGSAGGLDVIAVALNKYFNIRIGKFFFAFNALLFACVIFFLETDLVIASLILVFIASVAVDSVLSMFSQRKLVIIISHASGKIAQDLMESMHQGATFIRGRGAYSGREQEVLLTVTNSIRLKKVEEIAFRNDPNALFIVEDTFSVIGSNFSRRREY